MQSPSERQPTARHKSRANQCMLRKDLPKTWRAKQLLAESYWMIYVNHVYHLSEWAWIGGNVSPSRAKWSRAEVEVALLFRRQKNCALSHKRVCDRWNSGGIASNRQDETKFGSGVSGAHTTEPNEVKFRMSPRLRNPNDASTRRARLQSIRTAKLTVCWKWYAVQRTRLPGSFV